MGWVPQGHRGLKYAYPRPSVLSEGKLRLREPCNLSEDHSTQVASEDTSALCPSHTLSPHPSWQAGSDRTFFPCLESPVL